MGDTRRGLDERDRSRWAAHRSAPAGRRLLARFDRLEQAARTTRPSARRDGASTRGGCRSLRSSCSTGTSWGTMWWKPSRVRAALIAEPWGTSVELRSISQPWSPTALYELVALTDGSWATRIQRFVSGLALGGRRSWRVGLLDLSSDFALVLNVRLDEQSFENARQRMAAILTRYGRRDLRHAPSGRAARRPGGHDRDQPGDDVSDVARAGGRRPRETPPRRWDQHRGRGRVARLVEVAAPDEAPAL